MAEDVAVRSVSGPSFSFFFDRAAPHKAHKEFLLRTTRRTNEQVLFSCGILFMRFFLMIYKIQKGIFFLFSICGLLVVESC